MKWVTVKQKEDLPDLSWKGIIKINELDVQITDGAALKRYFLCRPSFKIKWLDESNDSDKDMYQAYLHGMNVQENGGTIWEDWLAKYKSKSK